MFCTLYYLRQGIEIFNDHVLWIGVIVPLKKKNIFTYTILMTLKVLR